MVKPKSTRLREQRERQAAYREEQTQARIPSRDDVARVALWWLLRSMEQRSQKIRNHSAMNKIIDEFVKILVSQGFSEQASEDVIDQLVQKYVSGWRFQMKPHLRSSFQE